MGKKARSADDTEFDHFYCSVDKWEHSYHLGVNLGRPKEGRERFREIHDLKVMGAVRYRDSTRKRPSKFDQAEVYFYPTNVPREEWREGAESIGGIWQAREGKLCGSVTIPVEVFQSLLPCLGAGAVRQMVVSVYDLRYSRGRIYGISLDAEVTPIDDLE